MVRQHDEGRIAGPDALVGEEGAAEIGIQLQDVEVVAAHVLDPDPLGRSAIDRQQPLCRRVGGQTLEDLAAIPVVEVLGIRQLVRELRGVLVELRHDDELLRVGHRQGLKEQRVRPRGDRGRRPDADRERQRRRRRERGSPGQGAQADPRIGPQVVEPRQPALVAQRLQGLGHAAQTHAGHPRGLGRRVALRAEFLLGQLEMKAQLALEIGIGRVAPEHAPEAVPELAQDSHSVIPPASRAAPHRACGAKRPGRPHVGSVSLVNARPAHAGSSKRASMIDTMRSRLRFSAAR